MTRPRRQTRRVGPDTDFLNGTGAFAGVETGLNDVDLWIGGLAEKPLASGGLLGSTFNFVFETQMENLQNGDRFYYLSRLEGTNFLNQLEGTSFSELVMRNTDTTHLPFDVFAAPTYTIEAGDPSTYPVDAAGNPLVTTNHGGRLGFLGDDHVVIGGTDRTDRIHVRRRGRYALGRRWQRCPRRRPRQRCRNRGRRQRSPDGRRRRRLRQRRRRKRQGMGRRRRRSARRPGGARPHRGRRWRRRGLRGPRR